MPVLLMPVLLKPGFLKPGFLKRGFLKPKFLEQVSFASVNPNPGTVFKTGKRRASPVCAMICAALMLTAPLPAAAVADPSGPASDTASSVHILNASETYAAGLAAAKSNRIGAAIALWTPLAESGHTEAQYGLGLIYSAPRGDDFPANHDLAHRMYHAAAKSGHVGAVFELAFQYERGHGTEKNMKKAIGLYHIAAFKNHLNAQFNLAILLANGEAGKPNYSAAYVWATAARHNAVKTPHPTLDRSRIGKLVSEIRAHLPHATAMRAGRTAIKLTGQPI